MFFIYYCYIKLLFYKAVKNIKAVNNIQNYTCKKIVITIITKGKISSSNLDIFPPFLLFNTKLSQITLMLNLLLKQNEFIY